MIQTNVAQCECMLIVLIRECKIKHFTEREFSGIFSLVGGILRFQNGNSRWPWTGPAQLNREEIIRCFYQMFLRM